MNKQIDKYLNQLFEGLSISDELKEELRLNLNDKFDDLVSEGMDEDDAYRQVIAGIGDIEELNQKPNSINQSVEINIAHAPNRNLKIAAAVFFFIMSVVPLIILDEFAPGLEVIGTVAMFFMIAIGVVILITLPKETSLTTDDKHTPETESKQIPKGPQSKLLASINGLIWLSAVFIFFGLNIMGIRQSWLIFVIAGLGSKLAEVLMNQSGVKGTKDLINTVIWASMIVLFFTLRVRYSWLFFVLGAILSQITTIFFQIKEVPHESK